MICRKVFILALCAAAASCAMKKTSSAGGENSNAQVVDAFADSRPEKIVIRDSESFSEYGPSPQSDFAGKPFPDETSADEKEKGERSPLVALDLYPALYNSLGYVSTFAALEKNGIDVNIVSASGFSSVIAALYAKHGSAGMVEWKSFELYQLLGDKQPFQEEWRRTLRRFLEKEFGKKKLSQLKKLMVVPRREGENTALETNRETVEAIMESVNLSGNASVLVQGNFDYLPALKNFGADVVRRISFLPSKILLKHPDGFVFGVYSKLAGRALSPEESKVEFVFGQAVAGEIDSFNNLSDIINQTREENETFAKKAFAKFHKKPGKI